MEDLDSAYDEFIDASRRNDGKSQAEAINEMGKHIKRGKKDWMVWGEVRTVIEQQRKTAETEIKNIEKMNAMMTLEDLLQLGTSINSAINETITDPKQRRKLIDNIRSLMIKDM